MHVHVQSEFKELLSHGLVMTVCQGDFHFPKLHGGGGCFIVIGKNEKMILRQNFLPV